MNTPMQKNRHYTFLERQFQQWLRIENYKPKTVVAYTQALSEFFTFLEKQNICHVSRIEQKHLTGFKNHLRTRTHKITNFTRLGNRSINSIIKAINCFGKLFTLNTNGKGLDIYEDYLPVEGNDTEVLTRNDIMKMYNATFEPYRNGSIPMGQRDRVMIAIFYGCGIRLNEGRNINLSDIDFFNKRILVRHGKGSKERYVPVPNKHLADIQTYIQEGRNWFRYQHYSTTVNRRPVKKKISGSDEQALFLTIFGTRMKTFYQRLEVLCERAGITRQIGTHTLRHSVATHLLQSGWKLEQVSTFLGHVSIDSTQIYTHIVEQLKYTNHET